MALLENGAFLKKKCFTAFYGAPNTKKLTKIHQNHSFLHFFQISRQVSTIFCQNVSIPYLVYRRITNLAQIYHFTVSYGAPKSLKFQKCRFFNPNLWENGEYLWNSSYCIIIAWKCWKWPIYRKFLAIKAKKVAKNRQNLPKLRYLC